VIVRRNNNHHSYIIEQQEQLADVSLKDIIMQDHHYHPHQANHVMQPDHVNFKELHEHIHRGIDISKVNLSSLPENERNHLLLHQKHFGHEGMHAAMLLILIAAIAVAQVILITWKKKAPKNYQNVSMFGMWLVPFGVAIYNHWWRFIGIWAVMSLMTASLIFKPLTARQINGSIPRLIYRWFYYVYAVSSFFAFAGYLIVMGTFVGINVLLGLKPQITLDVGFLMLFYGIYYGVLTRDFTDFLVDILAANIGYYSPSSSLPSKQLRSSICAICGRPHGNEDVNDDVDASDTAPLYSTTTPSEREKTFTLSCGHKFHEYCIYGWSLVGKKQMCPFCREKVDTSKLFSSLAFQKPHYLYGNLLDFIRYLLAWQPLIIFAVQGINYFLGLE